MALLLGVTLSPAEGFLPQRVLAIAKQAERLGYRSIYFPESNQADAIGLMHAAAGLTSSIRLGTAVIPIQTRTPALVAMAFSVLSYLAPGRIFLGVGHSSPNVVGKWHGKSFDPQRPMAQVEEFIEAFRACLTQERAVYSGKWFSVDGLRLRIRPSTDADQIPVLVGVLGDRALEAAASFADGALMSYVLPERLERIVSKAKSRARGSFEVVVSLNVAVLDPRGNVDEVALAFRRQIVNYAIVDAYANAFGLAGYGEAVKDIRKAWNEGDRKGAVERVPLEMCTELASFGTARHVASRVQEYLEAGAAEIALSVIESPHTLKAEEALRGVAEALSQI